MILITIVSLLSFFILFSHSNKAITLLPLETDIDLTKKGFGIYSQGDYRWKDTPALISALLSKLNPSLNISRYISSEYFKISIMSNDKDSPSSSNAKEISSNKSNISEVKSKKHRHNQGEDYYLNIYGIKKSY